MNYKYVLWVDDYGDPYFTMIDEGKDPSESIESTWVKHKNEHGLLVLDNRATTRVFIAWYQNDSSPNPTTFTAAVRQAWESITKYNGTPIEHLERTAKRFLKEATEAFDAEKATAILQEAIPRTAVETALNRYTRQIYDRWLEANDVKNAFVLSDYLRPRKASNANENATGSISEPK